MAKQQRGTQVRSAQPLTQVETMTDLDAILQYLKRPATDYAYMITGPWGSGKTYFWKNTVVPILKTDNYWNDSTRPIPVYISLYGLKELSAVMNLIYISTNPKLVKSASWISFPIRIGAKLFNRDKAYEELQKIGSWFMQLFEKKQILICFDDIERCECNLQEILGVINEYSEHYGLKVVLLCNEEILEANEQNYRTTKEKAVRITRKFAGNADTVLAALISDYSYDPVFHPYLIKNQNRIKELFNKSNLSNFRILKYSLHMLSTSYGALTRNSKNDISWQELLIDTLLPVIFEHQSGKMSSEDAQIFLTEGTQLLYSQMIARKMSRNNNSSGEEDDTSVLEKFQTKYELSPLSKQTLKSPALAKFILEGSLDNDMLYGEINFIQNNKSPEFISAINFMENSYALSDVDFDAGVNSTLKALRNGEFNDWETLLKIARNLSSCQKYGFIKGLEPFREAIREGINKLVTETKFTKLDERSANRAGRFPGDEDEFWKWTKSILIDTNNQQLATERRLRVASALKQLNTDPGEFHRILSSSQDDNLGDYPIVNLLNAEQFIKAISLASPNALHLLSFTIQDRYLEKPCHKEFIDDIALLNAIQPSLLNLLNQRTEGRPSHYWLSKLIENIDLSLKKLGKLL